MKALGIVDEDGCRAGHATGWAYLAGPGAAWLDGMRSSMAESFGHNRDELARTRGAVDAVRSIMMSYCHLRRPIFRHLQSRLDEEPAGRLRIALLSELQPRVMPAI